MRVILVTGADGFIGTRLCSELQKRGCSVRGTLWQPASLPDGCESVVIDDISRATDWSAALQGVDTIIHLAARVHVMDDNTVNPLEEFRKVNVAGTERLAKQAAAAGVRRMVFMSSVKVNGEGRQEPHTEADPPDPEDAYGVSKQEAEDMLRRVAKETGLEVVIIRSPLVYGPGVKANFLKLLTTVWRGFPLPFGDILNHRSFIGLGNLVDAIIACTTHPKAAWNTYLVSDGEDVSTPELVRRIAVSLGRQARLFPFPSSILRIVGKLTGKSDAVNRLLGSLTVDISKIRRELGWKPPFTMAKGLAETAEWFRNITIKKF